MAATAVAVTTAAAIMVVATMAAAITAVVITAVVIMVDTITAAIIMVDTTARTGAAMLFIMAHIGAATVTVATGTAAVVERLWPRPVLALDSCRVCLGLQLK